MNLIIGQAAEEFVVDRVRADFDQAGIEHLGGIVPGHELEVVAGWILQTGVVRLPADVCEDIVLLVTGQLFECGEKRVKNFLPSDCVVPSVDVEMVRRQVEFQRFGRLNLREEPILPEQVVRADVARGQVHRRRNVQLAKDRKRDLEVVSEPIVERNGRAAARQGSAG